MPVGIKTASICNYLDKGLLLCEIETMKEVLADSRGHSVATVAKAKLQLPKHMKMLPRLLASISLRTASAAKRKRQASPSIRAAMKRRSSKQMNIPQDVFLRTERELREKGVCPVTFSAVRAAQGDQKTKWRAHLWHEVVPGLRRALSRSARCPPSRAEEATTAKSCSLEAFAVFPARPRMSAPHSPSVIKKMAFFIDMGCSKGATAAATRPWR